MKTITLRIPTIRDLASAANKARRTAGAQLKTAKERIAKKNTDSFFKQAMKQHGEVFSIETGKIERLLQWIGFDDAIIKLTGDMNGRVLFMIPEALPEAIRKEIIHRIKTFPG